jgi:hypothetical protein
MGKKTAEKWFDRHSRTYFKERDEDTDLPFYMVKKRRKSARPSKQHNSQGSSLSSNPYSDGSDAEEAMFCAICQMRIENNQQVIELKCQHIYHAECAKDWVLKEKRCPTCRKR